MTYYDQTFEPYKIVDGKCVVADESELKRINRINRSAYSDYLDWVEIGGERPPRPIIKVPTDIFEDVEGGVFDSEFRHLFDLESEAIRPRDLLARFFQTVDSTPYVDYLIVTQHPELVRDKLPVRTGEHPCIKGIDCNRHDDFSRSNVILATYVETQNDIERLVTELASCHDLCKGLAVICNPREELDFRAIKSPMNDTENEFIDALEGQEYYGHSDEVFSQCPAINLLVAEGNEHPIHPQWLRSLRDQCKDVVPFNFAGWGRWAPVYDPGDFLGAALNDEHLSLIHI